MDAAASPAGVRSRSGTIAFLRDYGTTPGLFTIKADGSGLRRLTPPGPGVATYAWSPDGSRIAYLDAQGALWIVRPDGTEHQLLAAASSSSTPWGLTWSPDGMAIAVVAGDQAARRTTGIVVIPTDGGEPRRLPSGEGLEPAWSPRGHAIAFTTPSGQVMTIRSDGRKGRSYVGRGGEAWWSPDGTRLAFQGCRRRRGRCVARYAGIYVADADGRNLHLVTGLAYNEYGFAWSPDGRSILYGRANRKGIYIIGADGRNNHRLTRDSPRPVAWGALTWAPDGHSVAYATDRTGNGDIYVIGADGRNDIRLTHSAASDIDPSWEP